MMFNRYCQYEGVPRLQGSPSRLGAQRRSRISDGLRGTIQGPAGDFAKAYAMTYPEPSDYYRGLAFAPRRSSSRVECT